MYFSASLMINPPNDEGFFDYFNIKLYILNIYSKSLELTDNQVDNLYQAVKRYVKKRLKSYPDISGFIALSQTSSKYGFRKEKVKTGKRGRPKIIILGVKENKHIHFMATDLGDDKSTNRKGITNFLDEVKEDIDKRFKRPACNYQSISGIQMINYFNNQGCSTHYFGNLNFKSVTANYNNQFT